MKLVDALRQNDTVTEKSKIDTDTNVAEPKQYDAHDEHGESFIDDEFNEGELA